MIAAGGTAGHVLPVARRRAKRCGAAACSVSFAGSPDRIEARLVPEAGFEFDPFRISGLPRRPGARAAAGRAARRAGAARVRADPRRATAGRRLRRRRLRRRADGLRGVEEADPGGADGGGRAPRAGEPDRGAVRAAGFPRLPGVRAATGRGTGSSGGRCRRGRRDRRRPRRGARFDLPADGPVVLVFGGSQGARPLNEIARRRASAPRGRPCSISAASATWPS